MPFGWNDGWVAGLWMVVFWGALVGVVYLLVRGAQGRPEPPSHDARQILDERFARGDISEEEYRERGRVLEEMRR